MKILVGLEILQSDSASKSFIGYNIYFLEEIMYFYKSVGLSSNFQDENSEYASRVHNVYERLFIAKWRMINIIL